MGARISALLRRALSGDSNAAPASTSFLDDSNAAFNPALLSGDAEWDLLKTVAAYSEAVAESAVRMDPSCLAAYLYELSKNFSRFYHDCPILNAGDRDLAKARLALCRAVERVLRDALHLICIPFLEAM
jgi:arginyl-tRNA synthetase